MKNSILVSYLAEIAAIQARIEAMKAANASRADAGLAQAYGEDDFLRAANDLDDIAACARNL